MSYATIIKRLFTLVVFMLFLGVIASCGRDETPPEDTPTTTPAETTPVDTTDDTTEEETFDYHDLSVRDFKGYNGMVASAASYASKVGVDILKAGGNAFDAAIAIAFVLSVTEPNASGLGGGGYMVGYLADTGETVGYDYREFAPGAATIERYQADGLEVSGTGIGTFGIPMFVDGMLTVYEDRATLPLEVLMAPAIELARDGFEVPPSLAEAIASQWSKLLNMSSDVARDIYSVDGFAPLGIGDTLVNEDLAGVLEHILEHGREGFYKGDVALAIVNAVQAAGGLATMADMDYAIGNTIVKEPIAGTYKNMDIISMFPTSSGGTTLVQFFNMIEAYNEAYGDIGDLTHNSVEYLHVLGTAMQIAYGDRRCFLADPEFPYPDNPFRDELQGLTEIPIEGLIDKEFAKDRFLDIFDPTSAIYVEYADYCGWPQNYMNDGDANMPEETHVSADFDVTFDESGSTTHFTVIDSDGNMVSATHTINYFFGNGIVVPGVGITLNNTMTPFSMLERSTQRLEPYKRPLSNMSPTLVLLDDQPYMAIGSPGSMRITSAIVQVFLNIVEFDMDVQSAIEAPRIFHYIGGAASPYPRNPFEIEGDMDSAVIDGLEAFGYDLMTVHSGTSLYFGGVHAIVINLLTGEMHGGADTRRDGKALGH